MEKQYQRRINQFLDHFESHRKNIDSVQPLMYRKLLYSAALDPLARAAFGNIKHRVRIVRLIDQLSSWSAAQRVSLPQLSLALLEKKRGRHRLHREVARRLRAWNPGEILRLDQSPMPSELTPFAGANEDRLIHKCRYAELFYTYRNNLVHEFREPGYGIEMSSDGSSPYYHSYINGPWELVFPIGFFTVLYKDVLLNLKKLLMAEHRDPYKNFEFGSLWN